METNDKRLDYEEKLRTIKEDLSTKYNEQIDGMKKREASNTLRMNARLACIARQRDEMETKLHLMEKKYENMKKRMSRESSSITLGPETVTRDGRSVDNGMGAVEPVPKLGLGVDNGLSGKIGEMETDLQSVKEWMKDTNGTINDIRAKMTEMENILLNVSKKFDKFIELHEGKKMETSDDRGGQMERKDELTAIELESRDECPSFEVKSITSDGTETSTSTVVRQGNIIAKMKRSKLLPVKVNELFLSDDFSSKINEKFERGVKVEQRPGGEEDKELQHGVKDKEKNGDSCESISTNLLQDKKCLIQKETGESSSKFGNSNLEFFSEKMNFPSDCKVNPSDLREVFESTKDFSENANVKESVSEGDLEGNFRFDETSVDFDAAAEATRQLGFPFMNFLNRLQQLCQKMALDGRQKVDNPPVWKKIEDETLSQQKLGTPKVQNNTWTNTCTITSGNSRRKNVPYEHTALGCHSNKGPPCRKNFTDSLADNFTKHKNHCCSQVCSRYHTQKCSKGRTENCSRCFLETCNPSSTEGCGMNQTDWCPKCLYGDFLKGDSSRTVDNGLFFSDYIQRHVVKSSTTIASLRDLKPGEW